MKPCLNSSTSGGRHNFLEYLNLAAETGYEYIEGDIGAVHQLLTEHGASYVQELFASRGVSMPTFGLPIAFGGDEEAFQSSLKKLPELARTALIIGADRCCTWLWPSIDEAPVPYASRLARRFRESANVLAAYGIRLGLEFVGPHHLREKKYPFVYTIEDTLEYIAGIGANNIGLLFDSFHWYTTEATVETIKQIPVEKIVHVHVNDSNQSPKLSIDNERLLPGEGKIDLEGMLQALQDIGYHGPLAIEVLRAQAPTDPAPVVAKRAYDLLSGILANVK